MSAALLSPLGVMFGLMVAFLAAQIWGDMDRGNTAVNGEASALRAAVLLSSAFPGEPGERLLEKALEGRRQRILVSRAEVNWVKWMCLLIQAMCTLTAIAVVHSDNRVSSRIALGLFSTAIAGSILLLVSHDRPFTGELSISPAVLLQVQPDQSTAA